MSHLFLSLGNQPFISLDWQVVAQLLNTLILFLILKKILFVKVKEFIDARQTEVDKMYADADTAMAEAERLKNIYSESVAGARDEAQRIVTDARRSAQDQADQNTFDQAELVPFAKQFHEEVPFWPKAGEWRVFRRKRTSVRPDKEAKKRHA